MPSRRRLVPWAILTGLAVLIAGAAALGAAANPTGVFRASGCPAPSGSGTADYTGLAVAAAESCIAASGAAASPLALPSTQPKGIVVSQWPDTSASPVLTRADTVYLFVSSGPWHGARQVLPLAVGAPRSDECARPVTVTADGNVAPLTCPGGGVNVDAWDTYVQLRPPLMSAGRQATERAVLRAYCGLGQPAEIGITGTEIDSVFVLASAYYGWRLTPPGPAQFSRSGCAAVKAPLG